MRFALVLSLAFFVTSVSPEPAAAQRAPSKEQVRAMLSGVDTAPSDETWQRLGPNTLLTLIALYDDPSTPLFVRMRAVSAAAHYPIPPTKTFLEAVARAPGQRDLIVRRAIVALGEAFGEDALASVRPFLAHPEPSVREGAVRTITAMGTPAARAALQARARVETDPTVRAALGL